MCIYEEIICINLSNMHLKWFVCINSLWYAFDSHVQSRLVWILLVFCIVVECCTQCMRAFVLQVCRSRCSLSWYRDIVRSLNYSVYWIIVSDVFLTIIKCIPRHHQMPSSPSSNDFLAIIKSFPCHHQITSSPMSNSMHCSLFITAIDYRHWYCHWLPPSITAINYCHWFPSYIYALHVICFFSDLPGTHRSSWCFLWRHHSSWPPWSSRRCSEWPGVGCPPARKRCR